MIAVVGATSTNPKLPTKVYRISEFIISREELNALNGIVLRHHCIAIALKRQKSYIVMTLKKKEYEC